MPILAPQQMLTARSALLGAVSLDVVSASEPPQGSTVVPGIPDAQLSILGDIGRFIGREVIDRFFPGDEDLPPPPGLGEEPCPGLTNVRLPNGQCFDPLDPFPGDGGVIPGPVNGNGQVVNGNGLGPSAGFGQPVNGRFGVGVFPRVEALRVRRCPKGMALGKDGVCYDGLGRNSPKREWPMGMKPLLTPGERNAIRIAGVAAGKLARSQKTLKKTAKALEKVC